jgi:ribosomal protein L11 methyltransferase
MLYRLSIDPSYSLEKAWSHLEEAGIEILYGSEEEGEIELFAHLPSPELLSPFSWVIKCEPYTLPPIDWQAQWAIHGHNFQEGYVNIDLTAWGRPGSSLRLQPGSGFGDLSHPTTRLMLNMLAQHLHNQIVIDIGCGSGVLSVAAAAMGAPMVYGIDIDPQAIEHSHQNALLNHLEAQCAFCTPSDFRWSEQSKPVLILMNMIRTEQLVAWPSLMSLHGQPAEMLTSGIRSEERLIYLEQMQTWGWSLKNEQEEMGWLAFHFVPQIQTS